MRLDQWVKQELTSTKIVKLVRGTFHLGSLPLVHVKIVVGMIHAATQEQQGKGSDLIWAS
jgi:hypothetical protein